MKVRSDPRDLVRGVVMAEYRPASESIEIVREKIAGKDAAFAVAFEDRDGVQRRGVLGMCRHDSDGWQSARAACAARTPTGRGPPRRTAP